jgi:integrase
MRGDGSVFKRGRRWWVAYYVNRKLHREPGGSTKQAAKDRLQEIHKEVRGGTFQTAQQRRVTVSDLLDDVLADLTSRGLASADKAESHAKAVKAGIGQIRADQLDTAAIGAYQKVRLEAGRQPATVNRECELLRRAFRLALRVTPPRVCRMPYVPLLKVDNARQGFLSAADFTALAAAITNQDVRDFVTWLWWTGMRPGEARQITWTMLDRETWTLNLDPRAAKTRKGRVVAVTGPLREIIDRRLARRRLDCTLVFHRMAKGKSGRPIKDFSCAWKAALKTAALPSGLLPYDLRRSALRNMVRGGTDYTVAMRISGHRTRSTFDRYNIVSTEDLELAITRTAAYVATLPTERTVVHSQNVHTLPNRTSRR